MQRVGKYFAFSLLLASFLALGQNDESAMTRARLDAAKTTSQEFLTMLGDKLKVEMAGGGPKAALAVCRNIAPEIANELSLRKGWQITRVSSKPRNTMLGIPDEWEQGVFKKFEARLDKGEDIGAMSHSELVDELTGKSFRYMQAIETKDICLSCHGSAKQISSDTQERLNILYPHDRAIGYKVGELRGAVSIKQPIYPPKSFPREIDDCDKEIELCLEDASPR